MPDLHAPGDRTPEQRDADHASLARLSETLVPALVAKLNASGLGELEVREGDWRIRLRRAGGQSAGAPSRRPERRLSQHAPDRDARPARDAAAGTAAIQAIASIAPEPRDAARTFATSPAVGVFRPSAQPGARLRAGDRVGIVDLLGIPQDVVSPIDGVLAELLVPGGEAVEYGEPVAALEPAPDAADGGDGADGRRAGEG